MTELLGFLPVKGADNYLHVGFGIEIFSAGMLPGDKKATSSTRF